MHRYSAALSSATVPGKPDSIVSPAAVRQGISRSRTFQRGERAAAALRSKRQAAASGGRSRDRREEVEVLRSLGCRLGYLDKEMQIRQIEFLENNLEVRRNQLREKLPEQKKICQTLGILGGILLAVLFW